MRTFLLVCVVALVVACGVAYAVGLVTFSADHPDGRYIVTMTVNTEMIRHGSSASPVATDELPRAEEFQDVKGKITAIRLDQRKLNVAADQKTWTFQLARDGRVSVDGRESQFSDLRVGDEASVTYDHEDSVLIASSIRCNRN